ncbi:hypothetical protein VP01_2373g2 [Puccinia sorghi]|uniref:Uncharacterized protein n=1 Tax=Puccinia sorghi TaxID=27349 RepID=A0A0L6V6Y9_9BASI|nr:hypothetical protein VP01_2373g2 [Puccinia sorghi]
MNNIEAILGYCSPLRGIHQYLVWWCGGSWESGGFFSPLLYPYLEQFHDLHNTDSIILPQDRAVRKRTDNSKIHPNQQLALLAIKPG